MGLLCTGTEVLLYMYTVSTKDDVQVLLSDAHALTESKSKY